VIVLFMSNTSKIDKLSHTIFYTMAESHILITLFHDLKAKIHELNSKKPMMDASGIEGMKEVIKCCDSMDRYIDSFAFKEEHRINIGLTYDAPHFTLSPASRTKKIAGPTAAMRRYAEKEEQKLMDRIDQTIQMGKQLDANQDKPYFTIDCQN
jgi:hypothetical protein